MIQIKGSWFVDEYGRTLLLRGANLDAKVPAKPDGATHITEGFFQHADVSFVGRPFPLEEADSHFTRLRHWGLTFFRFLVPWEAVEHRGPGMYDEEYLDYLCAVVEKAHTYGLNLFIDSRQDVWSRFSGGDGAPGWTFDLIGMDITRFKQTGAAVTHQAYGDQFLPQVWALNGHKLAAATMYTLFFGGNDFAPRTKVDGEPIQEYLQRHRINAYQQVAKKLKDMPNVIGYDTMNEPWKGYIGCHDLNSIKWLMYRNGDCPTAFQGMLLGSGIPQEVEVWRAFLPKLIGKKVLNPDGEKVWREGFDCVWKANGVWDIDSQGNPLLLRPHHFTEVNGRKVDFMRDYIRPYYNRFAAGIRSVDPDAVIFLTPPNEEYTPPEWGDSDARNIVFKPHWFDDINWISKSYLPYIHPFVGHDRITGKVIVGLPSTIQKAFINQLRRLKVMAQKFSGGVPTLIGETGINYDMNKKEAYRTGNFKHHIKVWDRILHAMDANLLNYTLWTYNAGNDNTWGDHWNLEDFSIFSLDQRTDPTNINSGGRALEAIVRPYPMATAGEPLRIAFHIEQRIFEFDFRHDPSIGQPTEIFVPEFQYPWGYAVEVSDGTFERDAQNQLLIFRHTTEKKTHRIRITPQ